MESKKSTNDIIFAYMQNRNKLTDIEGKFTITKGERGERRDKLGDVWLIYVNLTGSQGIQIFDLMLFSGLSLMFPKETNI